jgi:hypothetical protein
MIDGKATAYVCRSFACSAPSTDPSVFDAGPGSAGVGSPT